VEGVSALERTAKNEAVFREVNERIEEVAGRLLSADSDERFQFVCECSREGCADPIEVSLRAYERVREQPTWFIIVPGHENLELERIIERRPAYTVVEKIGEAGEVAERLDPRS
jgi:hypothetical protein